MSPVREGDGEGAGGLPLVVNREAGRGGVRAVRAALESLGLEAAVDVRETDPARLRAGVAAAAAERAGAGEAGDAVVAVCGGDGTHGTAAEALAGTGVALIPVPTGTLNNFAARYGSSTVEAALALVRGGPTVDAPVGVADDRLFLNTLVVGAYSAVVERRERLRRVLPRWPAAALAFALTLPRLPRLRVVLETADRRLERETAMVWVGLGRGSYPRPAVGGGAPAEAVLEVGVLPEMGRARTILFMARLLARMLRPGQPTAQPGLDLLHVGSMLVRSGSRLPATLDGEPARFASPLHVGLVPGALRVRVPER